MLKILAVLVPAAVMGIAGYYVGIHTNGIIAVLAGVAGGAIAGCAALGVMERKQSSRGVRARRPTG